MSHFYKVPFHSEIHTHTKKRKSIFHIIIHYYPLLSIFHSTRILKLQDIFLKVSSHIHFLLSDKLSTDTPHKRWVDRWMLNCRTTMKNWASSDT